MGNYKFNKMASFQGVLNGVCPRCEKAKIFSSKGNIFLLKVPKMNSHCSACDYRFDKEPGYFLGAMYVSYGLTILEMLFLFFTTFWFVPLTIFFIIIGSALVLFSLFNFRVSRIIWIHLFSQ